MRGWVRVLFGLVAAKPVNQREQPNQAEAGIEYDARNLGGGADKADETKEAGDNGNKKEDESAAEHEK